jgi:hypothetical protein
MPKETSSEGVADGLKLEKDINRTPMTYKILFPPIFPLSHLNTNFAVLSYASSLWFTNNYQLK